FPWPQPAQIGEDGSFRLEAVQPGRYRVTLSWGPAYVKSMRLGQVGIEGNILDLTNGSAGAPLSLLVSSAVAEISGVVRDDKGPAAGVRVVLVQAEAEMGTMPGFATSGADGTYKIGAVAPGKYKLAAVEESAMAAIQSIELDYEDELEMGA